MNMEEVNLKYQDICQQIGDTIYKIKKHEELLKTLLAETDKLNELAALIPQTTKE